MNSMSITYADGTLADAYEELYTLIAASRAAAKSRRKRAAQEK